MFESLAVVKQFCFLYVNLLFFLFSFSSLFSFPTVWFLLKTFTPPLLKISVNILNLFIILLRPLLNIWQNLASSQILFSIVPSKNMAHFLFTTTTITTQSNSWAIGFSGFIKRCLPWFNGKRDTGRKSIRWTPKCTGVPILLQPIASVKATSCLSCQLSKW